MPLEHVDVLIVGAGLSGIGAAHHLQANCPRKTYAILEARETIGGTWDLFRYPGIRSDSDMYTLGYRFRPWKDAHAIADGPAILDYVRETARDGAIERNIRFRHRVLSAEFSSEDARWTVHAQRGDTGETVELSCGFLLLCSGYYRYDEGYTPDFPGTERFAGRIVHPQHWSEDIDYTDKRVVVIGSGATAVTLVPAMAEHAAHVTMLQRSPSYVLSLPGVDPIAGALRRVLPAKLAYPLVRWKNVLLATLLYQVSRRRPALIKRLIRKGVERRLPPGYDIDTHFKPRYDPWDQRMCLVPDGDLFEAISAGRASVVTDRIETFTENGLALASGAELEADLVVTATGLNMLVFGGIEHVRRRAGGGASADDQLQGHDARRRAQHGVRDRLHQRLVDAQVRPHMRIRLPPAQPHGRGRIRPGHARRQRPHDRAPADDRLLLQLRAARDRAVPQAGIEAALAPVPELPA